MSEVSDMHASELIPVATVTPDAPVERPNLLGMTQQQLEEFFIGIGEQRFRAAQVLKWIHQAGVVDFTQMSNISKALRDKLAHSVEIRFPEVQKEWDSADGCRKFLLRVTGGSAVESVFIPEGDRGTLCVSSQVGCSLDCSFCATGKQGFQRDLSASEIIAQVWLAARSLDQFGEGRPRRITNVVFMGMGEPLLNFDNVVAAMNIMMDDNAYGISKRRVTISTSGVVPALDRLSQFTDASLAISLHAPNDALRNQLVPINKKYPIAQLLASAQRYIESMPDRRRKITVEYTLIDGVNDRPEHARELAALLETIPVKINLIPFNPFSLSDYKRVKPKALKLFQDILIQRGHIVTIRTTRGDDIAAACGQLAGEVNDRTRRSQRYQQQAEAGKQSTDAGIENDGLLAGADDNNLSTGQILARSKG